jgi:tight adherence protein C
MNRSTFLITLVVICMVAVCFLLARYLQARRRVLERWYENSDGDEGVVPATPLPRNWLTQWLYLAGYRDPMAPVVFVSATAVFGIVGFGSAILMRITGLQATMERAVVLVPGGVGETFLPVVWVSPWMIAIMMVCVPWVIVRGARRKRIELVEQDLPLALELLATLSEAGLGFDSALSRVLKTRLAGRPLASELRVYQSDLLAGRKKVDALRRFSSRLRIGSVSILVSALVQAEQMGVGIARVLRNQADDIRGRRRERAIAFANSLPIKRLFPLVICFLPGLFVWTLGPAFVQLFKLTETFTRGTGF